ncbi:rod shape-determining protein [Clostridiaceae bacterium UIB06]|uniref:Rod shape-determining protein n=1 Tax=Clostridium thailandense TaxID=2794346 RepID=A0A949TK46_9CLOT|nr:cell division FtsA domain-containing protein [Clostridium thailandense]MBV7274314.1 rod shape-determining protein [Clostridium thailandense]MCH5136214.1 rod shape-determining protein [Clostridiaceae bacterium UIB06]
MDSNNINPQDLIFALDIGTRSVIGTIGIIKDKKFNVIAEHFIEHEERAMVDGQIHDISLVASAVSTVKKHLENKLNVKIQQVAIAAAGRFLRTVVTKSELKIESDKEIDKDAIRSLELTAVKAAEEKINNQAEGKLYCVGYSVKNYYLNGYIIANLLSHKGENVAAEVIATFLPRSVVDSLYSVIDKVGLQVSSLTLEPIAAMEAAVPKNLRLLNLALVDVGAGTSDIAISSKETISAYGMVPMAGDEVTEIIAQNYLVDFNTAETIKKQCSEQEKITYIDVLGLENEILSEDVIKLISPIVRKISDEIGSKIIELNGDKSPNAVFLVGGGAHTPKLREFLAEKLNLQIQRVGIKGRESVVDCVCLDNSLGSIGVTVLGIALISIKRLGHDFIDVFLNNNVISLFNSHKHTIMDVMVQAGINPKVLIGRNGKNIRFMLNDIKRLAFGTLAINAEIKINSEKSSIDEEVKEGDNIEINYAMDGKDASPKVKDYVKKIQSISFFVNDILENLEPVIYINSVRAQFDDNIREGDEVQIVYPETLGEYKKYFRDVNEDFVYFLNGEELADRHIINEGDRIYRISKEELIKEKNEGIGQSKDIIGDTKEEKKVENQNTTEVDTPEEANLSVLEEKKYEVELYELKIIVNEEPIILKEKKEYIFVDIFDYIDFDLTVPKGNIYLRLNGKNAGYHDKLSAGDVIEIGWE